MNHEPSQTITPPGHLVSTHPDSDGSGDPAAPRPGYLPVGDEHAFVVYHPAAAGHRRDCAVVLCPPFGWEATSSHRGLRDWANQLAQAGYPVLRLTFPSMGDSSGNVRDPGRLDVWTATVTSAAQWLAAASGASSVVALGLSLGGIVAYRAAGSGAPIDGLILWSTPARGRDLVRQLRAFARLEQAEAFAGLADPGSVPTGELEAGGFLLSAETVAALEALDLSAVPPPARLKAGVLTLGRDGIDVSAALREVLDHAGIDTTSAPGHGYGGLTSHPQEARSPVATATAVATWLAERSAPAPDGGTAAADAPGLEPRLRAGSDAAWFTETPVEISLPDGTLPGVLCEPGQPTELCAVFLNAGAISRIGPSRLWVDVARRWAARGVPSLRLDVTGIGEADGAMNAYPHASGLYRLELVAQVVAAIDDLQARGVAERFVLVGMCAGAYWS
ncbi:MAG: alpha/beta family hydrolase, partial [Solirubrobacteraceae bacterium]